MSEYKTTLKDIGGILTSSRRNCNGYITYAEVLERKQPGLNLLVVVAYKSLLFLSTERK